MSCISHSWQDAGETAVIVFSLTSFLPPECPPDKCVLQVCPLEAYVLRIPQVYGHFGLIWEEKTRTDEKQLQCDRGMHIRREEDSREMFTPFYIPVARKWW